MNLPMCSARHAARITSAVVCLVVVGSLSACGAADESASDAQAQAALTSQITEAIERYAKAANDADEAAARDLWAFPDRVSYINPLMRLQSMDEVIGFWRFLKSAYT